MSQYRTTDKQGQRVLYGFDHALGYWMDFYAQHEPDMPIREESSLFTSMSNGRMLTIIEEEGVSVPKDHLNLIGLDLQF